MRPLRLTRRLLLTLAVLLAAAVAVAAAAEKPADPPPERWTKQVEAYEKRDAEHPPAEGGVVFAGSSSIRRWPDLEKTFKRHGALKRGIGGSHISDQIHWADRLILRYKPSQIVFYAGDNDVAGGKRGQQILEDFKEFVATVRKVLPKVWIHFIAIKPSPRRESMWPDMARANRIIAEYAETDPRLTFINIASPMLDEDGRPRRDIFLKDMLHMNRKGYALWNPLVAKALAKGAKEARDGRGK